MCKNFGVPGNANGQDDAGAHTVYKKVSAKEPVRLKCSYCEQSFAPKSNRAIRPIARYFLSLSLPFATCPNSSCSNYGVNVFENYAAPGRPQRRHYHKVRESAVICRECKSSVPLGEKLGLRGGVGRKIEDVLAIVFAGVRIRRAAWYFEINENAYVRRLQRCGARLQSYHSWLNAGLLSPHAKVDFSQTARVYTDVMDVSLRRTGDVTRFRHLKVIFSVLAVNRTSYVLAAHPYFLPDRFGPSPEESYLDRIMGGRSKEFASKWDCLEHPVHIKYEGTPEDVHKHLPDVSRWGQGLYIRKGYAEIAHFLVIRKMLQRFKRIHFYMDGARELIQASMTALAQDIRAGRIEVALVQQDQRKGARPPAVRKNMGRIGSEERRRALHEVWEKTEAKVQEKFDERLLDGSASKADADPARPAAQAFKQAMLGAFSDGEWAWMRFPAPIGKQKEWRTLWLTRMPTKTFADAEELLLYATLQPVDTVMGAIRDRVLSYARPINRASQGRSFRKNYTNPQTAMAESSIHLLGRNYALMSKDGETIPAQELGLFTSRPPFASVKHLAPIVEQFRLGLTHAEKITRWRRR